ncbi:hypothetical protein EG830_09435, partial [bacterium]|nr:hypothetical protein [bacterium]
IIISIHSNAISDKRFTGAETYVLGQSMDDANLQVAMKENSVITFEQDYQTKYEGYDPSSVESFIIFSLMQNTYLKQSTEFATLIQNQFRDRVGRKDRGVRQAGFVVLWRTTMPSVLVELGFITNAEEEKFLLSEQGQDYLASAIFRAFRDYRQGIDSRSGIRNGNGVTASQGAASGKPDTSVANTTGKPGTPVTGNAGKPDTSVANTTGKPGTPVTGNDGKPASKMPENTADQAKAAPAGTGENDSTVPVTSIKTEPESGSVKDNTSAAVITERTTPSNEEQTFFMVQVAAMPAGRELSHSQMNGIETVTRIKDGERIKYAAGKYVLYDDALKYRRTLTGRFPDAFVIAVRNGKIIPLREAIEAQKRNR